MRLARLLACCLLALFALLAISPARAVLPTNRLEWWRSGATLDLDFINDRYWLNGTLYSGIANFISGAGATFSRASTATYLDASRVMRTAAANTPRLDHDPLTGANKGILIEEARTNMLKSSEQIGSTGWGLPSTVLGVSPDVVAAPNNTVTMDRVYAPVSTTISEHYLNQVVSPTLSTTYTYSAFAEPAEVPYFCLRTVYNNGVSETNVRYNLSTGVITVGTGVYPASMYVSGSAFIQNVGNGISRIGYSFTTPSVEPGVKLLVRLQNISSSGSTTYVGDGNGVYIWGAQLEQGAFPTSYIATTSADVTRPADVFTVPTSAAGANGAWYTAAIGTVMGDATKESIVSAYAAPYSLNDGTDNNVIEPFISASLARNAEILIANSQVSHGTNTGNYTLGTRFRSTIAFQANNCNAAVNGSLIGLNQPSSLPSINQLRIGALRNGYYYWNGWVNRMTYFPTRQPDASLSDYTR